MRPMVAALFLPLAAWAGCLNGVRTAPDDRSTMPPPIPFHSLATTDIHGQPFPFSQLKGSKVMVVNTASKCGFTPQYAELQALHERSRGKGLVIIGFPCNQFGGQEPGTEAEIAAFCQKDYGVAFPMMAKVKVKGPEQHPVYAWLTRKAMNGVMDAAVKWNFHKFLIDGEGRLAMSLESRISPLDERVLAWIDEP